MTLNLRQVALVILNLFAAACVSGEMQTTNACRGEAPTEWYLRDIAPSLPIWQQHPELPMPGSGYIDQGKIELVAFEDLASEELRCWSDRGDRLATLALAVRLTLTTTPPRSARDVREIERLLRASAADRQRNSEPCAEPFCHGVPEAMYRLAIFRRSDDAERRELLERASRAGFTLATLELRGEQTPTRE